MVFTTMRMEVEAEYCGLVIGKGGAGLRYLESMPGVISVEFSPIFSGGRNPVPPAWHLTVRATSSEAGQAVLDAIWLRIVTNAERYQVVAWLLLPEAMAEGRLTLRRLRDAAPGMELLNSIFSQGFINLSSQTQVFVWFSTFVFPFFKMLYMNRLEFSCFADILYNFLKWFSIKSAIRRDCE
jgi:hypothetical protein